MLSRGPISRPTRAQQESAENVKAKRKRDEFGRKSARPATCSVFGLRGFKTTAFDRFALSRDCVFEKVFFVLYFFPPPNRLLFFFYATRTYYPSTTTARLYLYRRSISGTDFDLREARV